MIRGSYICFTLWPLHSCMFTLSACSPLLLYFSEWWTKLCLLFGPCLVWLTMKAFGPEVKSHPLTTTMCSVSAVSVNLVTRKHSDVASGGIRGPLWRWWEWRQKETKRRETKMMGGIQMHLSSRVNSLVCLFSFPLGHWIQKKGSSVWAFSAREHLQMCANSQDGPFSPLKAWLCMLAQKATQTYVHTWWHSSISVVWPAQPPLRAYLPSCLKCCS